jgi:hypothetical protein
MSTFGKIKTSIENTAIEMANKPEFKRFIFEFNSMVLNNKDISELYFIYDDLSTNKGLDQDLANDYINESIEYSQVLIESQSKNMGRLSSWIDSWNESTDNNHYTDIDNAIYNAGIRNLEFILESKKNIKNIIIAEEVKNVVTETYNIPLSSMVKVANDNLKKEVGNLNENDRKELDDILTLTLDEVKQEMSELKEIVVKGLKTTLTESKDGDLNNTIQNTINKITESKVDHYNLYKLRQLNSGL